MREHTGRRAACGSLWHAERGRGRGLGLGRGGSGPCMVQSARSARDSHVLLMTVGRSPAQLMTNRRHRVPHRCPIRCTRPNNTSQQHVPASLVRLQADDLDDRVDGLAPNQMCRRIIQTWLAPLPTPIPCPPQSLRPTPIPCQPQSPRPTPIPKAHPNPQGPPQSPTLANTVRELEGRDDNKLPRRVRVRVFDDDLGRRLAVHSVLQ